MPGSFRRSNAVVRPRDNTQNKPYTRHCTWSFRVRLDAATIQYALGGLTFARSVRSRCHPLKFSAKRVFWSHIRRGNRQYVAGQQQSKEGQSKDRYVRLPHKFPSLVAQGPVACRACRTGRCLRCDERQKGAFLGSPLDQQRQEPDSCTRQTKDSTAQRAHLSAVCQLFHGPGGRLARTLARSRLLVSARTR